MYVHTFLNKSIADTKKNVQDTIFNAATCISWNNTLGFGTFNFLAYNTYGTYFGDFSLNVTKY